MSTYRQVQDDPNDVDNLLQIIECGGPRKDKYQLRVSAKVWKGSPPFLDVRTWTWKRARDMWLPSPKGITIRTRAECHALIALLTEHIEMIPTDHDMAQMEPHE